MSQKFIYQLHVALWFEENNPLDMLKFYAAALWNSVTRYQDFDSPTRGEMQSLLQIISQNGWVRIGFFSSFTTATHRLMDSKKIYKVFLFAEQTTTASRYEHNSIFPLTIEKTERNEVARASITEVLVSNVRPYKDVEGKLMYLVDFKGTAEKPPVVMPIFRRQ